MTLIWISSPKLEFNYEIDGVNKTRCQQICEDLKIDRKIYENQIQPFFENVMGLHRADSRNETKRRFTTSKFSLGKTLQFLGKKTDSLELLIQDKSSRNIEFPPTFSSPKEEYSKFYNIKSTTIEYQKQLGTIRFYHSSQGKILKGIKLQEITTQRREITMYELNDLGISHLMKKPSGSSGNGFIGPGTLG